MNKEDGETKQGAKKMALFFIYPLALLSLPSLFLFETEKLNWKNLKRRGKEKSRRDRPKRGI